MVAPERLQAVGGGEPHETMNNNEEQAVDEEEEGGEAWQRVSKKCKSEMSADELHTYFDCQLRGMHECPNLGLQLHCNPWRYGPASACSEVLMLVQCQDKV